MKQRPPGNDGEPGVVADEDLAPETTSTKLKKIPLVTTVTKEFDDFAGFVAEFGQHVYPQGMFVPSPRPKAKGSRLKLDFRTRDGVQILEAICEVVRSDEALPGTLSGMWVAFTNISDRSRDIIVRVHSDRENTNGRDKPSAVTRNAGKPSGSGGGNE